MSRKLLPSLFAVGISLTLVACGTDAPAGPEANRLPLFDLEPTMDICHRINWHLNKREPDPPVIIKYAPEFQLLTISTQKQVVELHLLGHGDGLPGGEVPGLPGYVFGKVCEIVAIP